MRIKEILKNVFQVKFPNQKELASTFLRFSEYYENPFFRGKIFTLEEFKKWYITNSAHGKKTGRFTYYADWDGFNLPSQILNKFYRGGFNPLSDKERKLLNAFKNKRGINFYVIGTSKDVSQATKKHEIAHGLFNTNPEYKKEVLGAIIRLPAKNKNLLNGFLANYHGGYHSDFWEEESSCYLLDRRCLGRNGISSKGLETASKEIKKIFKKFCTQ